MMFKGSSQYPLTGGCSFLVINRISKLAMLIPPDYFSYFSTETYVVGTHRSEYPQHIFSWKNKKILVPFGRKTRPIWCYICLCVYFFYIAFHRANRKYCVDDEYPYNTLSNIHSISTSVYKCTIFIRSKYILLFE